MKIHNTEHAGMGSTPAANKSNQDSKNSNFANVLNETVEKSRPSEPKKMTSAVQPVHPADINRICTARTENDHQALSLLDTLEGYQHMLADADVTLRMLAPSIAQLEVQSGQAESLLHRLSEGDPVKQVLRETLVLINKEITRFNSGQYIDRN